MACVVYEALSGRLPHHAESVQQLLEKKLHPAKPLVEVDPKLGRLSIVVMRGLAKEPIDRYPSCSAFCEELREASTGRHLFRGKPRSQDRRARALLGLAVATASVVTMGWLALSLTLETHIPASRFVLFGGFGGLLISAGIVHSSERRPSWRILPRANIALLLLALSLGATALTLRPRALSVWNESPEIVEQMIQLGADPNHRDGWGRTPLEQVVWRDCQSKTSALTVEALLVAGAGVDLRFLDGQYFRWERCSSEIRDRLRGRGGARLTPRRELDADRVK